MKEERRRNEGSKRPRNFAVGQAAFRLCIHPVLTFLPLGAHSPHPALPTWLVPLSCRDYPPSGSAQAAVQYNAQVSL